MKYFYRIAFSILGFVLMACVIYAGLTMKLNGEITGCYDRYENLIIGEKCIVNNSFDNRIIPFISLTLIGILLFVFFYFLGKLFDIF